MSFATYQRPTSGLSPELPTRTAVAAQNTYPMVHQVPLSQDPTGTASNGQYSNTHSTIQVSPAPVTFDVPHQKPEVQSKTQI